MEKATSQEQTIYDPTCGSGSLLLKAADEAKSGISIYGQEMDNATAALAKMNMILHNNEAAEIYQDNTLANPFFKSNDGGLKTFDFAVANPPFSTKSWSNGIDLEEDDYGRFTGYGIPPAKNGDYAFLLHLIRSLKSNGKGAIILPHGVLFRGNVEAKIRENILKRGYIKGIIGLPANLFYGTGIPACILVIDKEKAEERSSIFMIDASKGFIKDGNKNRLREQDIHRIVDVFTKQLEVSKYSRLVSLKEIEENDYNLNIPRYIDSQDEEDIQDIKAHILGGIPKGDVDSLGAYWSVYPDLQAQLFQKGERVGYYQLKINQDEIKQVIFNHPQFISYKQKIEIILESWCDRFLPILRDLQATDKAKDLIAQLSESILSDFSQTSLIDAYDVYQHLMVYWEATMKDDVYLVIEEGWKAEVYQVLDKDGKAKKDQWDCDLVPKDLVISRYFADFQAQIEMLETEKDAVTREREEMEEEYSGEEGCLEDLKSDKGKISKAAVQSQIKKLQQGLDWGDDLRILKDYLTLLDQEAEAGKRVKEAQKALDQKLMARYRLLTEAEVRVLVVEDKWLATIRQEVRTELDRISQRLTVRVKELAERYGETLPSLTDEVELLTARVDGHLQLLMGV